MERFGMINLHRFPLLWQDQLQTLYASIQTSVFFLYAITHLYSTFTRAIRYQPEFIQTLLEDAINFFLFYNICFFRIKHVELNYLADNLDISFSRAYPDINEVCARKSRRLLIFFFSFVFIAILGSFIETILPLVASELELRREIYRTKHAERRLPYSVRVPFIDETESYAYEIVYGTISYVMSFFLVWVSICVSLVPIILIHLRGQYMILSRFVALIGRQHRDRYGYRIYYTSIEKNEYVIKMYGNVASRQSRMSQWAMEKRYERQFLRQILNYHRKLLVFQSEMITIITPFVYCVFVANNIIISLSLYQIVASPNKLTPLRYFKFSAELIAAIIEYFILCNCSEVAAECNELIRKALGNSRWYSCTRETRKDLIMFLRRVTQENHLRFFHGAIVLNRALLLNVMRVAYTFVNFMRLRMK